MTYQALAILSVEDISGRNTPCGGYIGEGNFLWRIYQGDILPLEDISGRDTPCGGYVREIYSLWRIYQALWRVYKALEILPLEDIPGFRDSP